jgi:hypothetical protein
MASQQVLTALESLHREIEKLEPAIKHVETAQQVTHIVKAIPQKHVELLQEVKSNDAKHKDELKNLFAKELSGFTEENKKLQKTTNEIQQQVKLELEALGKLKQTVELFHVRVEKINFPERLDKVDTNIIGIIDSIKSIQISVNNVERNITNKLHEIKDFQNETKNLLNQTLLESTSKLTAAISKHQSQFYITWFLILIVVLTIFILRLF